MDLHGCSLFPDLARKVEIAAHLLLDHRWNPFVICHGSDLPANARRRSFLCRTLLVLVVEDFGPHSTVSVTRMAFDQNLKDKLWTSANTALSMTTSGTTPNFSASASKWLTVMNSRRAFKASTGRPIHYSLMNLH